MFIQILGSLMTGLFVLIPKLFVNLNNSYQINKKTFQPCSFVHFKSDLT